jgi:hypothetical protein
MQPSDFFEQQLNKPKGKKKAPKTTLDELYTKPQREKGDAMPHFQPQSSGYENQIDLLYLPSDKGYYMCLVAIDQGNRKIDAEAISDKKSTTVLKALETIYARDILDKPSVIRVDNGAEWGKDFKKGLDKIGIQLIIARSGRHRALALIERKNYTIGSLLHKMMAQNKLAGKDTSKWVSYLPDLVKAINKKTAKDRAKIKKKPDVPIAVNKNEKIKLLNVGDRIRFSLDNPQTIDGKRLQGNKFRASDIRWSPEVYQITEVLLTPNMPVMYKTTADVHARTYEQLQVVKEKEPELYFQEPEKHVGEVEEDRFEVEKLLERKTENKKVYFLVKWKNYPKKDATWESRVQLMKDIPQAVKLFEKS